VKAELEAAFAEYERALVANDVATLDRLFLNAPTTIRYGIGENLYGTPRSPPSAPPARRQASPAARPHGGDHLRRDAGTPRRSSTASPRPARSAASSRPGCGPRRLAGGGGAREHHRRSRCRDLSGRAYP
jgi:hypothetical protein